MTHAARMCAPCLRCVRAQEVREASSNYDRDAWERVSKNVADILASRNPQ